MGIKVEIYCSLEVITSKCYTWIFFSSQSKNLFSVGMNADSLQTVYIPNPYWHHTHLYSPRLLWSHIIYKIHFFQGKSTIFSTFRISKVPNRLNVLREISHIIQEANIQKVKLTISQKLNDLRIHFAQINHWTLNSLYLKTNKDFHLTWITWLITRSNFLMFSISIFHWL